MRYGFDKHGGFWVVDDANRAASYSYPTSSNAKAAAKNLDNLAEKIRKDIALEASFCDPAIIEQHYLRAVEALKAMES